MTILLIGTAIVVAIYYYFQKSFLYWKVRGYPQLEPTIPWGNIGTARKERLSQIIAKGYKKFKNSAPAFGFYTLTYPMLIITDPELVKEICVISFNHFNERGFYVNEKVDPLWHNIFTVGGKYWKELRSKLSLTFTSGRIKLMLPIMKQAAQRMVDFLDESDVEIREIFTAYSIEVITNVFFGLNTKCIGHPDNPFRMIGKEIFNQPEWDKIKHMMCVSMRTLAKFFNVSIHAQHVTEFFMDTVKENLEYRDKNKVQRNDFFQLLLDSRNSKLYGLGFNEIAANSFLFFAAGSETSAGVMTYCSYELALNQAIQDRLRYEIEQVLDKYDGELTYEALMEMKYLHMVFDETVRKYSVVDIHSKQCSKEFKIPNSKLVIPKGTFIIISPDVFHSDPEYFPNPDVFDPERFNDENVKKIRPHTYIPFSEGPRYCIGARYGKLQTKIGLLQIIRTFRILPTEKTPVPMIFSPVSDFLLPKDGVWLKLEKI